MAREYETKKSYIVYPEIIPAKKNKQKAKKYIVAKAVLHLRRHMKPMEIATALGKSVNYVYKMLKKLR